MNVVLDTNVLISGTFWEGEAYEILNLVERKAIRCFASREMLEEYDRVVGCEEIIEKIKEKDLTVKSVAIKALELCQLVEPKRKVLAVVNDPSDNKFLECALEVGADYLITYDKKHLLKLKRFEGIEIVSPGTFLRILRR